MSESNTANTATPLPAPGAGENDPNLSVVPQPEAPPATTRGGFNKGVEAELSKALDICTAAQRPEYAPGLASRGIDEAFVAALVADILAAGQKGQTAVACDSAAKDATQSGTAAAQALVASLRTIQVAARLEHLPDHSAKLDGYLVGERLDDSRPLLERHSQTLIDKANEERPGGINTDFIERVKTERQAYVNASTAQGNEEAKGQQGRAERDALLASIKARRRKIQYAAEVQWPAGKPESVQARKDFKLPANRPYSY
jgi:hypothetical protein